MNEILEGNKLIAEFMGGKVEKFTWRKYEPTGVIFDKQVHGLQTHILEDLEYHTSWDWLMPVVEKIASLHSNKFPVRIQMDMTKTCGFSIWVEDKYYGSGNALTFISVAWQQVVAFINFYNQNKTS